MIDPTTAIVKVLFDHAPMRAAPITGSTALIDLGIDPLDLPMVILDLEDTFHICISYDDYEQVGTVRQLAALVISNVQKSTREARKLAATPRVKRSWTSTVAHQACA